MFNNPKESNSQFSSPLIKKFLGKGYICEEVVDKGSTIIHLRHNKVAGLLEYKPAFLNTGSKAR